MSSARQIHIIDHTRPETHEQEAWQGITWDYAENIRTFETLAVPDELTPKIFNSEFVLLLEYFNKANNGKPIFTDALINRIYKVLSQNLTATKFREACNAVYYHELTWTKLVPFLLKHHLSSRKQNSAAYQMFKQQEKVTQQEKEQNAKVKTIKLDKPMSKKSLKTQVTELDRHLKAKGVGNLGKA